MALGMHDRGVTGRRGRGRKATIGSDRARETPEERRRTAKARAARGPDLFSARTAESGRTAPRPATDAVNPNLPLAAPSTADRPTAKASKRHFTGHIVIGDWPGRVLQVESHLELNVAFMLLARADVVDIEDQVAFPWIDETGETKTHNFDFRVTFRDGRRAAIAVKAEHYLKGGTVEAELQAVARQVLPDFADQVRLMTERQVHPVTLHNAQLLHEVRQPDPEADAAAAEAIAGIRGAATLGDLTDAMGLGVRGFRALLRLLRSHRLRLVRHERITRQSFVEREPSC